MRRICVQSEEGLNRMVEQLSKHEEIGLDFETRPGWWVYRPRIAGIGVAVHEDNGYTGWYCPTGHDIGLLDKVNLPEELVWSKLQPILENPKIRKVAHGAEVESGLSKMYGIEVGDSIRCSQIATWLYDEETWLTYPRQLRLKEIVPVLLGRPIKTVEEHMGGKVKDYGTVPIDIMTLYNTDDSIHCLMLHEWCEPELKRQGLWEDYTEIEVPLVRVLRDMQIRGVQIDMNETHRQLAGVLARQKELEGLIYKEAGRPFNINSKQTLAKIIIEELGYPELQVQVGWDKATKQPIMGPYRTEKKQEYKTDDVAMQHFASIGCPLAKFYTEYVSLEKKRGTDLMKFVDGADRNGRFHPTFWQCGTKSGRFSGNLQQVPREALHVDLLERVPGENGEWVWDPFQSFDIDIRRLVIPKPGRWLIVCLDPTTRLLTEDLTWEPCGDIQRGRTLVGFDEELRGHQTKLRRSVVLNTQRLLKPCYRITTTKGEVVSSDCHRWVVRRGKKSGGGAVRQWVRTDELRVGDPIGYLMDPWETDASCEAAYLAGFFDGEGWCSPGAKNRAGGTVGFGQNEGPLLEKVRSMLAAKGFETGKTSSKQNKKNKVAKVYLRRGAFSSLRFLGSIRPSRLLPKSRVLWEGRRSFSNQTEAAVVLSVEFLGEREVVAIETTTKTFIAEGMLSHNCDYNQLELRLLAHYSQDPNLVYAYVHGQDLHKLTAEALDIDRPGGKIINFALAYGLSFYTLVEQFGEEKAKEVWPLLRERYRVLQKFTNAVHAYAHEFEFVRTIANRKRRLPYINTGDQYTRGHQERQAFNTMCGQGTAADIVKMAQRNLAKAVPEFQQVLQVHDEIIGEVEGTKKFAEQVAAAVKEVMESVVKLSVPLVCEPKICRTWREGK
jgi:DNA polymerase I-like protein with 3'-5' exonuclease and polymerase domains